MILSEESRLVDGAGETLRALPDRGTLSPDGRLLAAVVEEGVVIHDLEDATERRHPVAGVFATTWSPDGRWLYTHSTLDEHGDYPVHLVPRGEGEVVRLDLGLDRSPVAWIGPSPLPAIVRSPGHDRIATAVGASQRWFPAVQPHAVLARADEPADALAGAGVSGARGGPLLLSWPDRLPRETADELARLGVERVTVLGGAAAIQEVVVTDLRDRGIEVERVAGADRFATSARAAALLPPADRALVGNGRRWPDALALGAVAAAERLPVLLTEADALPHAVAEVVDDELDEVVVAGGADVVGPQVVAQLGERCRCPVRRLEGDDRTATAVAVADWAIAAFGWPGDGAILVRGDAFPDALAAGPVGGRARRPLLYATAPDVLGDATTGWLARRAGTLDRIDVLGSPDAVSAAVASAARAAAAGRGD